MNKDKLIGTHLHHTVLGQGTIIKFHSLSDGLRVEVQFHLVDTDKSYVFPIDFLFDNHICQSDGFMIRVKKVFLMDLLGSVHEYDTIKDEYYPCKRCGKKMLYTRKQQIQFLQTSKKPHKYCAECYKELKIQGIIRESKKRTSRKDSKKSHSHDTDGMHMG